MDGSAMQCPLFEKATADEDMSALDDGSFRPFAWPRIDPNRFVDLRSAVSTWLVAVDHGCSQPRRELNLEWTILSAAASATRHSLTT